MSGKTRQRSRPSHRYATLVEILETRSLLSSAAMLPSLALAPPFATGNGVGPPALWSNSSPGLNSQAGNPGAAPPSANTPPTSQGIGQTVSDWARGGTHGQTLAALIHQLQGNTPGSGQQGHNNPGNTPGSGQQGHGSGNPGGNDPGSGTPNQGGSASNHDSSAATDPLPGPAALFGPSTPVQGQANLDSSRSGRPETVSTSDAGATGADERLSGRDAGAVGASPSSSVSSARSDGGFSALPNLVAVPSAVSRPAFALPVSRNGTDAVLPSPPVANTSGGGAVLVTGGSDDPFEAEAEQRDGTLIPGANRGDLDKDLFSPGESAMGRGASPLQPLAAGIEGLTLFAGDLGPLELMPPELHDVFGELPVVLNLVQPGILENFLEGMSDWASSETVRSWLPWLSGAALAALALEIGRRHIGQSERKDDRFGPLLSGTGGWIPEGAKSLTGNPRNNHESGPPQTPAGRTVPRRRRRRGAGLCDL